MPDPPANLGTCLDGELRPRPGDPAPTILFASSSQSCVCLLALLLLLPPPFFPCFVFPAGDAGLLLLSPVRS